MNKKGLLLFISLFTIVFLVSCGGGGSSSSTVVDTTTSAKFQEVLPIISTNCQRCHRSTLASNAPMSPTTYSEISFFADSINTRINKSVGDSLLMPVGGPKLSTADIATIQSWISAGKLNN